MLFLIKSFNVQHCAQFLKQDKNKQRAGTRAKRLVWRRALED